MSRQARLLGLLVALLAAVAGVLAVGCSEDEPQARLEPVLGGQRFSQPVEVGAYPDGRAVVAERGGRVWIAGEDGERDLLMDLSSLVKAERGEGLLSLVLAPDFEDTGALWAYYFAADEPWRSVLSRFEVHDDSSELDSELVVLEMEQPGFNQNGGAIRFDDEGYLYLSVGDGSASTDPFDQGQDPSTLLATVLRLDVSQASVGEPYRVPPTNPFVDFVDGEGSEAADDMPDGEVRPEIFAFGFRNPWRMSIDNGEDGTGAIWLGDVGYTNAEEVNRVEAGGNYGWSILEGTRCLDAQCEPGDTIPPVYEYGHEAGRCAVVGGVVYRGEAIANLAGRYLFGDLCSGEIWVLPRDSAEGEALLLADLDGMLVTFGLDAEGEVLVADHQGGGIYRLVED